MAQPFTLFSAQIPAQRLKDIRRRCKKDLGEKKQPPHLLILTFSPSHHLTLPLVLRPQRRALGQYQSLAGSRRLTQTHTDSIELASNPFLELSRIPSKRLFPHSSITSTEFSNAASNFMVAKDRRLKLTLTQMLRAAITPIPL